MKARTVNFNEYNSKDDLNITLLSVKIDGAEPKINTIEIPYSSNVLDYTEAYGAVNYKNRNISMEFHIPLFADHFAIWSDVSNKLNGQRMKITFSADDSYYWEGRIIVEGLHMDGERWGFEISANVAPFKYAHQVTEYSGAGVEEGEAITLVNYKAPAEIKFESENSAIIIYGGIQVNVAAGTHSIPEIVLKEGNNTLTVKTTEGSAYTIRWRRGKL